MIERSVEVNKAAADGAGSDANRRLRLGGVSQIRVGQQRPGPQEADNKPPRAAQAVHGSRCSSSESSRGSADVGGITPPAPAVIRVAVIVPSSPRTAAM